MDRTCSPEGCCEYRGHDVGFCHKYKVILLNEGMKDFYNMHCNGDGGEMVRRYLEYRENGNWGP